jgi:hypothetical protein
MRTRTSSSSRRARSRRRTADLHRRRLSLSVLLKWTPRDLDGPTDVVGIAPPWRLSVEGHRQGWATRTGHEARRLRPGDRTILGGVQRCHHGGRTSRAHPKLRMGCTYLQDKDEYCFFGPEDTEQLGVASYEVQMRWSTLTASAPPCCWYCGGTTACPAQYPLGVCTSTCANCSAGIGTLAL